MSDRVTAEGWLVFDVHDDALAWSYGNRARRDSRYQNRYAPRPGDQRWVGDLGELVFDWWLESLGIARTWILEGPTAGKTDFVIGGTRVDVKTAHIGAPWKHDPGYGCQAHKEHVEKPHSDDFFFAAYEAGRREMLLVGGVTVERFRQGADYFKAGEVVIPRRMTLRPDHPGLYMVSEERLTRPGAWLSGVNKVPA